MATQLNSIVTELKAIPGAEHLLYPVNPKKVPDYYTIVRKGMSLQEIRTKIAENGYTLRQQFLTDVKNLLTNSLIYNGQNHLITFTAQQMFEIASMRIVEKEQKLIKLEKAINPLLDDDDMVGFCFILQSIVQKCKNLPKSVAFHTKVNPRKVPLYYTKVSNPMDLGTIESNIKEHRYMTVESFDIDIEQILLNSQIYNGPKERSIYTTKAAEIVDLTRKCLHENQHQLNELEANIQKMLEQAELESLATEPSSVIDDIDGPSSRPSSPNLADFDQNPPPFDSKSYYDRDGKLIKEEEEDKDFGVHQDLAMSGDEMGDFDHDQFEDSNTDPMGEDLGDLADYDPSKELLEIGAKIEKSGRLNSDLALSDSDDEDTRAKRPRIDDLEMDLL